MELHCTCNYLLNKTVADGDSDITATDAITFCCGVRGGKTNTAPLFAAPVTQRGLNYI